MPNNIDQYLTTIKQAERGDDVRDAVIQALKNIHNDTPITNIAHGHGIMPERGSRTFEPPAGTVWDSFTADPASGSTQAQTVKELEVDHNDTYEEDNTFYSKVIVKVPTTDKDICQDVFEITENNREYDPLLEGGWDGFGKIKVNISSIPVSGQFEVKFYDKPAGDPTAQVILTKLVSAYGNAVYDIAPPTSDIGVFTGWNPSPMNVTKNLECYPVFGQVIIDPTEILDDWTVICQRRGEGYPIGSKKSVAYGATFTEDEIKTFNPSYSSGDVVMNFSMMLYKVAEGEGGTHSTWLSSKIDFSAATYANMFGYLSSQNWSSSTGLRLFLNSIFFDHMSSTFKNVIKPVTKYSCNRGTLVPTQDTIWIPGTSEIGTDDTSPTGESPYDFQNTNDYLYNLDKLDAVSVKYIRTYFDNNRDYVISTVLSNEQGQWGNNDFMILRDNNTTYGDPQWFSRINYEPYLLTYARGGNNQRCINIGFCMG